MQRLTIVFLISAILVTTSGCATKKFVRTSVKETSDTLTARIETNEGEMKEIRDNADRKITTVDGRVTELDSKTTAGMTSLKGELKGDIQGVDQRATQGISQANSAAERASNAVGALDKRFQNRNHFDVAGEETIQFKFDSARLDKEYMETLDKIAVTLLENADAILVLEGRTDSTGNRDYNVRLGERRIEAVRRYLAVEKGVPVYKIHEISFGSEKPIAENKTRDGREKNRAVTMTLMVPKPDGAVASRNN
jgi:outer membrane protein OmpA-like peptidoglycan-associated protein